MRFQQLIIDFKCKINYASFYNIAYLQYLNFVVFQLGIIEKLCVNFRTQVSSWLLLIPSWCREPQKQFIEFHFTTISAVSESHKKRFFVNNSERREGVAANHVGVIDVKMTTIT